MSFIILVANMWGLIAKEWKGVSKNTRSTIIAGVATIIVAVLIVGYGNYLKSSQKKTENKTSLVQYHSNLISSGTGNGSASRPGFQGSSM